LMSNRTDFRTAELVELYDLRWQIELFFKELKSTLGFAQCRLRRFEATEGWLELVLVTFLWLEWHRARQLAKSGLTTKQKERWRHQRTHGLCLAVRRHSEQADLEYLARAMQTPGGIRRLRRKLRQAIPAEFRTAG
ncbi:transposase, partial [Zavarzinella formosa]